MKTTAELIQYVDQVYGVKPEYLWPDYPETFVFRHGDNRKWFGVVMDVERGKLGLPGDGKVFLLDMKTGPILGGSYLGQPGIVRAWHMRFILGLHQGRSVLYPTRSGVLRKHTFTENSVSRSGSMRTGR